MAKAVLISIRPEWVEKILTGEKSLELRKTKPKLKTPFKVYIYCTNPKNTKLWKSRTYIYADDHSHNIFDRCWSGGVVGEFVCDNIATYNYDYCPHPEIGMDYDCGDSWWEIADEDLKSACLTEKEFRHYAFGSVAMYGWHISNLKIYDTPKQLSEFTGLRKTKFGYAPNEVKHPPQSWRYVEELK